MWNEYNIISSFTWETSEYAYTVGEEIVRFNEKEYRKISDAFMRTISEYVKVLCEAGFYDGNLSIKNKNDDIEESKFNDRYNEVKIESKNTVKKKIDLQMMKIPRFKDPAKPLDVKEESFESNNTDNNSFTIQRDNFFAIEEDCRLENQFEGSVSWKNYFLSEELDEIVESLNYRDHYQEVCNIQLTPPNDEKELSQTHNAYPDLIRT